MAFAHYKQLSKDEWQAASSGEASWHTAVVGLPLGWWVCPDDLPSDSRTQVCPTLCPRLRVLSLVFLVAEEFLFTLPVSIRWEAMDDKLLKKYWQKRPKEREVGPTPAPCWPAPRADLTPVLARVRGSAWWASSVCCVCVRLWAVGLAG